MKNGSGSGRTALTGVGPVFRAPNRRIPEETRPPEPLFYWKNGDQEGICVEFVK